MRLVTTSSTEAGQRYKTGRLEPEDPTPQMREEFTDLYRRWRSEQQ